MKTVTREEFEAFVQANCRPEPIVEKDVDYGYECFVDEDGEELAFACYHSYKPAKYHIR